MEKKVIDLQHEEGEVEILLPKDWKWNMEKGNYIDSMILELPKKNPLDLVPKSFEEFCFDNGYAKEPFILSDCLFHTKLVDNSEDVEAFLALIQLRRLWHEWVKVLGLATPKTSVYSIYYDRYNNVVIVNIMHGILEFKEREHAEKFIECFKELLEKAKILL